VKSPPRLRLEPRPSRIGMAWVVASSAAISALALALPLDSWARVASLSAVLFASVRGLQLCSGRGVPALLHVGIDRRLAATARDGRTHEGSILDASYVGTRVTTIVWRPDDARWYVPARTILILPDTLSGDDFRQLRVLLRYGRPPIDNVASGVDAG